MADVFSKKKRSAVMAAIKSRGTRTTEVALRKLLRKSGIIGWRANLRSLPGTPDFAFRSVKVAIFVDGCFWHGCKICVRQLKPATNVGFWKKKIENNKRRDNKVSRQLRRMGWAALRIWEHDIGGNPDGIVRRIRSMIRGR